MLLKCVNHTFETIITGFINFPMFLHIIDRHTIWCDMMKAYGIIVNLRSKRDG